MTQCLGVWSSSSSFLGHFCDFEEEDDVSRRIGHYQPLACIDRTASRQLPYNDHALLLLSVRTVRCPCDRDRVRVHRLPYAILASSPDVR